MKSFLRKNSLSVVLFLIFFFCLVGQSLSGWKQYNEEMREKGGTELSFRHYIGSAHFSEATFENWESEFLQMAMYVLLTVFLRQKGSAESKSLHGQSAVDRTPKPHANAPWPVKKGGFWLAIYKNSLSIILLLLFLTSFIFHSLASLKDYNQTQLLEGKKPETYFQFLDESKLWFESFQNWQSEFISVFALVVLTIFFRQQGSPQSKPVDAPSDETGE